MIGVCTSDAVYRMDLMDCIFVSCIPSDFFFVAFQIDSLSFMFLSFSLYVSVSVSVRSYVFNLNAFL